jgi:hypothetical protein
MRKRTFAVGGICIVLAASALVVASASASTKALNSSAAFGPSIPKGGGLVNFTAYSDNDGPTSVLILTGDIGDYGHAVRITTSGSATQDNELQLAMSRGSFRLDISNIEGKLAKAVNSDFPTNGTTCSGLEEVSGTAPIVSGSGTRAYSGLQGTFHLNISINEVERWPACPKNDTSPYLAQTVFISGSGSVTLR